MTKNFEHSFFILASYCCANKNENLAVIYVKILQSDILVRATKKKKKNQCVGIL